MKQEHIEFIYTRGFKPAHFDAPGMMPGLTIVKPLFPPEKTRGGIENPIHAGNVPGNAAMLYEVILQGDTQPEGVLHLVPGDVVILRTAALDPLDVNLRVHAIPTKHIYQRVPDDEAAFNKLLAEEDARVKEANRDDRIAQADIERARAELVAARASTGFIKDGEALPDLDNLNRVSPLLERGADVTGRSHVIVNSSQAEHVALNGKRIEIDEGVQPAEHVTPEP